MAWNRLVKPDDDDELPDDIKNTPHLTLGRDEKGNIIYFSRLGALNEVLDWFNLDQIIPDLKEIANERKTIEEQAKDMAIAPLNKIVNSISPFIKTPFELLSNSSYYPDIRHPGTIRDKNYYIFNSFGLGEEYRRLVALGLLLVLLDSIILLLLTLLVSLMLLLLLLLLALFLVRLLP